MVTQREGGGCLNQVVGAEMENGGTDGEMGWWGD